MRNVFSKKTFITLLAGISLSTLKAVTYYISPTGNDNAAGTSSITPWQSISKLNSINLLPGTVVLFEGGKIFSGSINLDANDGNNSVNPIIISSYGIGKANIQSGTSAGLNSFNTKGIEISNLIFEGAGMTANSTDGIKISTNLAGNIKLSNIKIKNVEIRNYGKVGLYIYSSYYNTGFKDVLIDLLHVHDVRENGLFIKGYTSQTHEGWAHENVVIRNSQVYNVPGYADAGSHRGSGIIMAQVDSGLIEKSVAHHNGTDNTHCGGPGGIWAYDCNNITIQYCESYSNSSGTGCDGLGFDLDGGIINSVLQYNYSHDNDGAGYLLGQYDNARPWLNNTVRYNISENDGRTNSGGITLFKGPNASMNGCKIYNNTVYSSPSSSNSGVGAFTFTDWYTGITGIEVYNNIFQTTGGVYLVNIPTGYSAFFAGNLYWSTGGAFKIRYQGTTYSSVNSWRTATGNEQTGNTLTGVTADPLLTNAGAGIIISPSPTYSLNAYKTAIGSPAINAALDLNSLFAINTGSVDFFNSLLPAGNLRDIGAYEKPVQIVTTLNEANTTSKPDKIFLYPNPVNAGEVIHVTGGEVPYSIELYNMSGARIVKENQLNSEYYIPTETLVSGIYIINIIDSKGQRLTKKIIIR